MTSAPEPQPVYLQGEPDPVFATLHRAIADAARDTAVVLCPPFGWPEVCSYRALRDWAERMAADGYTTLRLSLPSTGDSGGGPGDPRRLDAWCAAVAGSSRWLRAQSRTRRVAVIGVGLGGLIACKAVAGGAAIDELVLWATPARGRTLVRELKATSLLEAGEFFTSENRPPVLPEGDLAVSGFLISAETVAALAALDLTALPFTHGSVTRALLLERDGRAPDGALHDRLTAAGIRVTGALGAGYAAMTSNPQETRPPLEVFARTTAWLDEASTRAAPGRAGLGELPPGCTEQTRMQWQGAALTERPLSIEQPAGRLAAVLSEPLQRGDTGLCAVLLNAGAIRRIGPGRMWVEAARRWAIQGVPTLRLDVEGIGDSDGDPMPYTRDGGLYVPKLGSQVVSALDVLQDLGLGERFVLGGLCAGAYWSFHLALEDPRVNAAYMLNPKALFWDQSLGPARDFKRGVLHPGKWRKLRRIPGWRYRELARWALSTPRRLAMSSAARARGQGSPDRIELAFDRLHGMGKPVMLLFSDGEALHEELIVSGHLNGRDRWPNLTLDCVAGNDHTLRPLVSQRQAHEALDRALARDAIQARFQRLSARGMVSQDHARQ